MFFEVPNAKGTVEPEVRLVQIQYLRSEQQEDHVFIDSKASISYGSPAELHGMSFATIHVQMNSTNQAFLRELQSDLLIESYDYFGSFGGWTSNRNFTITNPTNGRQELFLKIVRNYFQTAYAIDTVEDKIHTIEFTSGPASDRVFVRWGVFAALKYLEANHTEVEVTSLNRTKNPIMVEFLPTYISLHLPLTERIQGTQFLLKLEEQNIPPPSGFCYISAFLLDKKEFTLEPRHEVFFSPPELEGWTYTTAVAYTNLTTLLYPLPYPFELVNMAVWEPEMDPLLITATDNFFGLRNISNETYNLSLDLVYYYWQNNSGLTFMHEIFASDQESITHRVLANVSDAAVGSEHGLLGQYLRFLLPQGETLLFNAPDTLGKYEDAFIPLMQGHYELVKKENRVVVQTLIQVNDWRLSNTLGFHVTCKGDPCGGAEILVTQRGTFTSREYTATTDKNGEAKITLYSNGIETGQLEIKVVKDEFNYDELLVSYFIGASWIAIIAISIIVVVVVLVLVLSSRRRK